MIAPPDDDEPPPFLGAWKRIYTVVLLYLVMIIAGMYAFTVHFTR